MARTFRCTLVTPEHQALDAQVSYASVPAHDGLIGIMPFRAPLMIKLGDGALRLDLAKGETRWFFVGGGFAQMKGNALSLVAQEAVPVEQMQREEAQTQLKEAQAQVTHSDEAFVRVQRQQTRARTMLHLLDTTGK